jgi:UDP-2,4-diacetamido-2,4,6-trideoxy-beta-L-altropyranose hydrolase
MQLFIRAEGNPSIGLGHIMRCYALAETCHALGVPVTFLCSQASSDFLMSRRGFDCATIVLENAGKLEQRGAAAELVNEITALLSHDAVLVLDGYQFGHTYQKAMKQAGIKFAYFDDINLFYQDVLKSKEADQQHCADIIINGSESASSMNYDQNAAHCTLCLGDQYLLLRQEFHHLQPTPMAKRDSLLINFGGADIHNYSTQLLIALANLGFSEPVKLITGAAFQHQKALNTCLHGELSNALVSVQHIHDAQEMAPLMQQSRLAVCAAGGTQFELLACATPSILVVVADNQLPATQHAAKQGWCDICEWQEKVDINMLAKKIMIQWQTELDIQSKFEKAVQHQQKLTFVGAQNILKALTELSHS